MIDLKDVNRVDLSKYQQYLTDGQKSEFNKFGGIEHYRLLNILCEGITLVYDVGTYKGSSAIAMASAKNVVSYDVVDKRESKKPKNVVFKIGQALDDENILKADLILLDTYHDGEYETKFYNFLLSNNYKGILVLDDIRVNSSMMRFWQGITKPKEDLTSIGHYTGTGIVYFGDNAPKRCKSCG